MLSIDNFGLVRIVMHAAPTTVLQEKSVRNVVVLRVVLYEKGENHYSSITEIFKENDPAISSVLAYKEMHLIKPHILLS